MLAFIMLVPPALESEIIAIAGMLVDISICYHSIPLASPLGFHPETMRRYLLNKHYTHL